MLSWGTPVHTVSAVTGIIACIVAAVFYGLFSVLNKKHDFNQNVFMTVSWAVSAVSAAAVGLIFEDWVMPSLKQWLIILYLGSVVYAVAYLLWCIALNGAENTAVISNLAYLVPVLSMGVAALILGERLEPTALIALILVVGGILFQSINFSKKKKHI